MGRGTDFSQIGPQSRPETVGLGNTKLAGIERANLIDFANARYDSIVPAAERAFKDGRVEAKKRQDLDTQTANSRQDELYRQAEALYARGEITNDQRLKMKRDAKAERTAAINAINQRTEQTIDNLRNTFTTTKSTETEKLKSLENAANIAAEQIRFGKATPKTVDIYGKPVPDVAAALKSYEVASPAKEEPNQALGAPIQNLPEQDKPLSFKESIEKFQEQNAQIPPTNNIPIPSEPPSQINAPEIAAQNAVPQLEFVQPPQEVTLPQQQGYTPTQQYFSSYINQFQPMNQFQSAGGQFYQQPYSPQFQPQGFYPQETYSPQYYLPPMQAVDFQNFNQSYSQQYTPFQMNQQPFGQQPFNQQPMRYPRQQMGYPQQPMGGKGGFAPMGGKGGGY